MHSGHHAIQQTPKGRAVGAEGPWDESAARTVHARPAIPTAIATLAMAEYVQNQMVTGQPHAVACTSRS